MTLNSLNDNTANNLTDFIKTINADKWEGLYEVTYAYKEIYFGIVRFLRKTA